jgi:delta-aminolevulinic acid dehydratase/porphobilinogen synthase
MIKAAWRERLDREKAVVLETLLAMRRAGADILITYSATERGSMAGGEWALAAPGGETVMSK